MGGGRALVLRRLRHVKQTFVYSLHGFLAPRPLYLLLGLVEPWPFVGYVMERKTN